MNHVRRKVMIQRYFSEEKQQVFHTFLKDHMKLLFGDFNAKLGRANIFKLRIGKYSLNRIVMLCY
jgi:hypothetical protein